ncbi:RHS repeat-associated core domain-containing protein [Methylocaldum sp. SAD2]|uniref:RHS repeat-associated core domain-containing protein n=1 Tax=Methylocaldum sp. GT1BB TaxID=3438963 RepID=UPI00111C639E
MWSYAYDLDNRLKTANKTGLAAALAYDGEGRLRQTAIAGVTSNLLYDGQDLLAEYDGSGTLLRRYVHGPGVDEPLVWYEGTGTATKTWLYGDHLGSIVATADGSGASTAVYSYGPWGEPNIATGVRFRYTGQQLLGQLNLYHYKARMYSPALGRFLQTDPIGYGDDLNLYAYVGNNPVNGKDPMGLEVVGTYDPYTGKFSLTDLDSGRSVTVNAESGGKPFGDPIEPGRYEILERAGRPGFYRLDAIDANPRNDIHDQTGRDSFRLHQPGRTIGCIAVCEWNDWRAVDSMISHTSTTTVKDNFHPWWDIFKVTDAGGITKYGELTVIDSQPNGLSGWSNVQRLNPTTGK